MVRFSAIALSTLSLLISGVASAELSCSISSGPGQSKITILQQTEFIVLYPGSVKTVYSCGPFVNDGSVVVDQNTDLVELASDSCAHFPQPGYTQVVFCM